MRNFKILAVFFMASFFIFGNVSAEEKNFDENENTREILTAENKKNDVKNNFEVQLEYLSGKSFSSRNVNNYNVHLFQKIHEHRALSVYRGLTFTRAVGATNPRLEGIWKDSNGVGFGPAMLLRWEKKISGKLHASWDFSGSILFYNRAHPAEGRAYGFLWRTGPRLIWKYGEGDSISLGYSVSHFSNGMRKHNPGYNTLGFSLGISHSF